MPLLYYWVGKNYRQDLDSGAGFHLNQRNPLLHSIGGGDSLWAFTRTRAGAYVLAAELVVRAKTMNPPDFRYGRYRLWGDLDASRYFHIGGQKDFSEVLRGLSITARAPVLGRSFQGPAAVRKLNLDDHQVLTEYARNLPLEPRARLLPEDRLEARVSLGDSDAVRDLIALETPGIAEDRCTYLVSAPRRSRQSTRQLLDIYGGKCQLCGWNPKSAYRHHLCEAHHVRWLSRGGTDALHNMVLICPNHHRAIHGTDAPFDWADECFVFPNGRERLRTSRHRLHAS